VSSAVATPVIAAIEYNYEKDGEIVVPAGAKALGSLQQADRSGHLAIRFDTLQMPDGTTLKIDATALSLSYGPLKGNVSGKRTGTRFLVRTFTGLGTVATYLVGAGGSNGFNGPLSESTLLRDRIATNIGIAGDQELNGLAFNQNIVVTLPGNTRFYIVLEKHSVPGGAQAHPGNLAAQAASTVRLPTAEELRQLMQLKRELSEMYQQSSTQNSRNKYPSNEEFGGMEPIWKPLEERLGRKCCAGFMYMGRVNRINLYKHGIARIYLNLDDLGNACLCRGYAAYERAEFATELARLETALAQLGETLESTYDDCYTARKREAFKKAGIPLLHIEIEPEEMSIN
jgi:hypothetical protein